MENNAEFCKCVDDDIEDFADVPVALTPQKIYHVDFEMVAINTTNFKVVTITTPQCINGTCEYTIHRDCRINPIYQVFNLNKYNGLVHPKGKIEIKIKFHPNVPFQDFLEKFEFFFNENCMVLIQCRGSCIAPIVTPDITDLYFYKTRVSGFSMLSIILSNDAVVPAIFEFDADEHQDIFKVQKPISGKIPGQSKHKVFIHFKPNKFGIYSMQICCLICNHEPIIINLFGIYSETDYSLKTLTYSRYPIPKKDWRGYNAFFRNVRDVRTYVPPVSLSKTYINFGAVPLNENPNNIATEAFCLMNHMPNGIKVEWLSENKIFSINPLSISIPPGESMTFECRFKPHTPGVIYYKILHAQIFWNYDEKPNCISIPLNETLRAVGHSFSESEIISKTKIDPSSVTLPPCIPKQRVATTFMIQNTGIIPVLFKFIPPRNTNIILKPQIGVVADQRLICVQFKTDYPEKKTYIEQWVLILNDNCEKYLPVYLKVECATPNITVGKNDIINYGVIQTNTQSVMEVPIRNNTIYKIKYKMKKDIQDFFGSEPDHGILDPYDQVIVKMTYRAIPCSKSKFTETVELGIENSGNLKSTFYHTFKVYASSKYSTLFAQPSYLELGDFKSDSPIHLTIDLYNWGEATVHYKLYVSETKLYSNLNCKQDEFEITPSKGSINPKENQVVEIRSTATAVGINYVKISYLNRLDGNLDTIANLDVTTVLQFNYLCIYPTIKFAEILEHNYGKMFSKKHLWDMLCINQINEFLNTIQLNETKTIDSYMPEMPCSGDSYWIVFLVKAPTEPQEFVEIKRKKNCDCKLSNVQSLTKWKKEYNCPHRNMFSINWIDGKCGGLCCTFNIKYNLPGKNVLSFYIQLAQRRRLLINFYLCTVPCEYHYISTYSRSYDLNFHDVYVGDKNPVLHFIWLYNNTDEDVPYEFNTVLIDDMCAAEGYPVLAFVNSQGIVPAYSKYPLMFKFQPIEVKQYQVSVTGLMGDESVVIYANGFGMDRPKMHLNKVKMPKSISISPVKIPVCLSKDYMKAEVFSTWNSLQRMIFIKNVSDDLVFYYEFEDVIMEKIIDIRATCNGFGYLKPNQSQYVIITIKSLGQPISTDFVLNCTVNNICEKYLYEKNLQNYAEKLEEQHFKDVETNVSLDDMEKWQVPKPYYLSLHISLHIVSSNDKDLYLPVDLQFKFIHETHIEVDSGKIAENFDDLPKPKVRNFLPIFQHNASLWKDNSDEQNKFFKKTVECLIGNVVFSEMFQAIIKISELQNSPIYKYYRKLPEDSEELTAEEILQLRKEDTLKLFKYPRASDISTTFENVMDKILTCNYSLTTVSTLEDCTDYIEKYIVKHSSCSIECDCKEHK